MSPYSKTAISWVSLDEAVLYFSHVIPLGSPLDLISDPAFGLTDVNLDGIAENSRRMYDVIETELLPPNLRNDGFITELAQVNHTVAKFIIETTEKRMHGQSTDEELEAKTVTKALAKFFDRNPQLKSLPLISRMCINGRKEDDDISLTISSLKLIDTKAATLEQLFEFRRDLEAMDKLRRLRLFVYENYAGKSKEYIEDDILTRLSDYDRAVKQWGFTTTTGAINTLLNSTLIAGGIAGSFLTAYYQAPITAIATALGSVGLGVCNMAIGLGNQRFSRKELMATNPVSYISYAREKLGVNLEHEDS